ncbi:IS1016 transposase [Neisseria gonorrhoeae]|nr:IS1016 transposase [Neisseria gonorrhoeae]
MFDGEVEADESYFGGQRKGKRGRGAAGKVAVFRLLKRNGKVSFAVRYVRFVTFEDFLNPARRFGFCTPLLDKGGRFEAVAGFLPSAGASVITPATAFVIPCLSPMCESSKTGKKKSPVTCRK